MYCFDRSTIYVQTAPTKTFANAKLREKQQLNAIKVQNKKKHSNHLKFVQKLSDEKVNVNLTISNGTDR